MNNNCKKEFFGVVIMITMFISLMFFAFYSKTPLISYTSVQREGPAYPDKEENIKVVEAPIEDRSKPVFTGNESNKEAMEAWFKDCMSAKGWPYRTSSSNMKWECIINGEKVIVKGYEHLSYLK